MLRITAPGAESSVFKKKPLRSLFRIAAADFLSMVAVVLPVLLLGILDRHSSYVNGESGGDFFKSRTFINPGRPGPWIYASRGQVWPKPQMMRNAGKNFSILHPDETLFQVSNAKMEHSVLFQ